ncbi:MAG TPA: rhodanese-like domain-containing protein [Solirubrobacterales bacterium]
MSEISTIDVGEVRKRVAEGAQLVDVRDDHEWEAGHIPGAIHIPLPQLGERVGEIDRERPVVLYCRGGSRCEMATEALAAAGFDAAKLEGGVGGWSGQGLALEPEDGYVAESGEAASILEARKRGVSGG